MRNGESFMIRMNDEFGKPKWHIDKDNSTMKNIIKSALASHITILDKRVKKIDGKKNPKKMSELLKQQKCAKELIENIENLIEAVQTAMQPLLKIQNTLLDPETKNKLDPVFTLVDESDSDEDQDSDSNLSDSSENYDSDSDSDTQTSSYD